MMPRQQPVGILDALKNVFLPRDASGMPQAPGVGDFLNAALMAMPAARGLSPDALLTGMRRNIIGRGRSGRPLETSNLENTIPERVAMSPKSQFEALKAEWEKNGAPLDLTDVWGTSKGEKAWNRMVSDWNKANGTTFDPDNMPLNNQTRPIWDAFEKQFIPPGSKQKFPGISAANEYFEQLDNPAGRAVYLRRRIPKEISGKE